MNILEEVRQDRVDGLEAADFEVELRSPRGASEPGPLRPGAAAG